MADLEDVNKISGVFGGAQMEENTNQGQTEGYGSNYQNAGSIQKVESSIPTKAGFWNKFKAFWLQEIDWNQEIKVELTPYQQKIEDEINEFLHQEITWEKVHDFLFQEISFGRK